jgi:putative spermidine/putrescine transport system ATP-binding protein
MMEMPPPVLELRNVSRTFAPSGFRAVAGIDLQVLPGEIVSILGPSGCGKTTTLRMIAGLESPTGGDVRIANESALHKPPHLRKVGLVFQSLAIFPHMSVRQNVAFGLRMQRTSTAVIHEKVDRILDLVQLPPAQFAGRNPDQLSGGQLQRVALARTLVTEPALVLFDEPMASLDRRLRDYMAVELRAIQKKLGIAAVYVTHDQETASAMSDRIAIMDRGKIVQTGRPEDVYQRPESRFVAEFLGDANFLKPQALGARSGKRRALHLSGMPMEAEDAGQQSNGEPLVMFRPEHVVIQHKQDKGAALTGVLAGCQFSGGFYRWRVQLTDGQYVVGRSTSDPAQGDVNGGEVRLSVNPEHVRLLRQ